MASGLEAGYAIHFTGYSAVYVYDHVIEFEADRQGVDPDLVRAMMYTEDANGALYGPAVQAARVAGSLLPMNIKPDLWRPYGCSL